MRSDHGVDGFATVRGGDHLVAACAEGDGERASELRVVVGDEDLHVRSVVSAVPAGRCWCCVLCSSGRCPAIGSRTVTVSPPPGVSSTSMAPSMPSVKPRASARPSPRPCRCRCHRSVGRVGRRCRGVPPDAGSLVGDPDLDLTGERADADVDLRACGRVPLGVGEDVHHHALEQHGVGAHRGDVRWEVELDVLRSELEFVEGRRDDRTHGERGEVDGECPGLDATDVEQVAEQVRQRRQALVRGVEQGVTVLRREGDVAGTEGLHGCGGGGDRSSDVVADGCEDRAPDPVDGGDAFGVVRGAGERPVLDRGVDLSFDDGEQASLRRVLRCAGVLDHGARCEGAGGVRSVDGAALGEDVLLLSDSDTGEPERFAVRSRSDCRASSPRRTLPAKPTSRPDSAAARRAVRLRRADRSTTKLTRTALTTYITRATRCHGCCTVTRWMGWTKK